MLVPTSATTRRHRLRDALKDGMVIAPGVYDALSAKIAEAAGAQAVFVTGAGVSASLLGSPDVGLLTMTEVRDHTRNIVRATQIPVVADCDTGYGNPVNVRRTVQEFEDVGVAALFLEDQVAPKKCGHFAGKQVVPVQEMAFKLQAALDARTDPDLVIIARTDARATHGIDEAISRARSYAEVGVDMVFVEAPQTADEVRRVMQELGGTVPVMVNLVEGGKTPLMPIPELRELGVSLLTYSGSAQKVAIKSMQDLYAGLTAERSLEEFYPERMVSLDERSNLLGLPQVYALEERYS